MYFLFNHFFDILLYLTLSILFLFQYSVFYKKSSKKGKKKKDKLSDDEDEDDKKPENDCDEEQKSSESEADEKVPVETETFEHDNNLLNKESGQFENPKQTHLYVL